MGSDEPGSLIKSELQSRWSLTWTGRVGEDRWRRLALWGSWRSFDWVNRMGGMGYPQLIGLSMPTASRPCRESAGLENHRGREVVLIAGSLWTREAAGELVVRRRCAILVTRGPAMVRPSTGRVARTFTCRKRSPWSSRYAGAQRGKGDFAQEGGADVQIMTVTGRRVVLNTWI